MVEKIQEKKNTKQRIFDAAVELFSRNGFSGTSIREIVSLVGIRESSLYKHYGSKDELLDEIFEYFKTTLGKASFSADNIQEAVKGVPPELFLQHTILKFRERLTPELEKIWRILYTEQFRDKRARDFILEELHGRPVDFYEKVFAYYIDQKLIKPYDPRLLAYEFNYTLTVLANEFLLLRFDGRDVAHIGKRMLEHTSFFVNAVKM